MSLSRGVPWIAALALALVGSTPRAGAQAPPQLVPTRDVDITYEVTRPPQPKIRERVRWSASGRIERIDGPDRSTTIFDHGTHEITLLVPASRTYRKLEGAPGRSVEPEAGSTLQRGAESIVAGQHCVDWSWKVDGATHTVCATADGVLIRLVVDGKTEMLARSVRYGPQPAQLFEVPPNYSPALAPEGGP